MAYQGGEESCRPNKTIIAHWYSLSMIILNSLFAAGWRVSAGVGGWKVENLEKIGLYGRRRAEQSREASHGPDECIDYGPSCRVCAEQGEKRALQQRKRGGGRSIEADGGCGCGTYG